MLHFLWNNSIHMINTILSSVIMMKYFVQWTSTQTCDENVTLAPYQIHRRCPADWNVSSMFSQIKGGTSSMPYHFTHNLFKTFPHTKHVKEDQDEQRYMPLQMQMCIDITEKCKFHIILNCWKIEYFEKKIGAHRELHVQKFVCSNTVKFLPQGKGVHEGHSDTWTPNMIDISKDLFIVHCDCNNGGDGAALIVKTNLNPKQIRMNTIL